jgi:hypothetical protein
MTAVSVWLAVAAGLGLGAPPEPARGPGAVEGLWSGSWGGGVAANGVGMQPVIAELFIKGDQVELAGFPKVGDIRGTVRLDAAAKRLRITPVTDGRPASKPLEYTYELKGNEFTIIDGDQTALALQKLPVTQNPLANARIEFVTATGINDAGELLVTEYTVLRAGRAGATYYQPNQRSLSTKQATVFVVQEAGLKPLSVADARPLIRNAAPVAVTYRPDDRPAPPPMHQLWKELGPPMPDGEAVRQTFARVLRPGTLVFVLSARENIPQP